jgi:small subunit ribosomal protein S1
MHEEDRKANGEPGGETFSELLEGSLGEPLRREPGEKVTARIVSITSEWVFLDLGGKGEGCLDKKEFQDESGGLTVREGDTIQAYFLSAENNEMRFTTKIGGGAVGRAQLEDAWRNGIPAEGTVEREIKGGFEVRLGGGFRGFCPYSQMGMPRSGERGVQTGGPLLFRITRFHGEGREIVLSHRAILEEKRKAEKESLKKTLREGTTVVGTVTSIREFGVFVSIGGIEGLVPASEIGWDRAEEVRKAVSVGQEVSVTVVALDWERERFTFSLKKNFPDPWENVEARYPPGTSHTGKVSRLFPFGAFVTLESGVDGLLHISKLGEGKKVRHPCEAVIEGQEIRVKVESLDRDKKRMSLAPAGDVAAAEPSGMPEDYRKYMEEPPRSSLGTLGEILRKKLEEKENK